MTDEDLLLLKRIVATPGVLGGKPRIDGTRVGVSTSSKPSLRATRPRKSSSRCPG